MAKKSALDRVSNAAVNIKKIADIVRAFMQGGWGAAIAQAVKHYWPQITVASIILTVIPLIIMISLPMAFFGFESSTDPEISAMTTKANAVTAYYDNYDLYCDERVAEIKETILGSSNTENANPDSAEPSDSNENTLYEVQFEGQKIQKSVFMAIHSVSVGNDLNAVNEEDIRAMVKNSITHSISESEENTEILTIRYLTSEELMDCYNFSDSDREWVNTLTSAISG